MESLFGDPVFRRKSLKITGLVFHRLTCASNPTLSAIFFNNLQALQSVCNHSLCFSVEVMTISISRSGRALTQFVDNAHSSMCRHST